MPNRNELDSLINSATFSLAMYSAFNASCAPSCTVTTCSCTNTASYYWSSTTDADTPAYAWDVYFDYGFVFNVDKTSPLYVRAVRGGS